MRLDPTLGKRLERVAVRQRHLQVWTRLTICWTSAALLGLVLLGVQHETGWASKISASVVALAGLAAVITVCARPRTTDPDWRGLARQIEAHYPELDGRLLTAVQQHPKEGKELNYLQERVLSEVLCKKDDWLATVPVRHLRWAQAGHWLSFVLFVAIVASLRTHGGPGLLARGFGSGLVSLTPGDATIERGSTLVVLARFKGRLPTTVDLVVGGQATKRVPLVKSLADPMFGGSVPEVTSNFVYHLEYSGQRTRDFQVTVFEYPRLERADANVTFPDYTGQSPKQIENTRRVSAVQGSRLALSLQLNKPVTSASLLPKEKDLPAIPLRIETNRASASIAELPLKRSARYELRLLDDEGRTNKVQSEFVFEVTTNQTPELRLASPRGDLRPSPLEEINFEGTVWDDFGVQAYGIGYALVGQETRFIELGHGVPSKEKRPFHHLLRLEDLNLQPDELISWFVWADDIGPDGRNRRTTGDLYFAEIRPFEEVFREGQSMDGQQGGESGRQSQAGRLADLQKQIINATWKLQHEQATQHGPRSTSEPQTFYQRPDRGPIDLRLPNLAGQIRMLSSSKVMGRPDSEDKPAARSLPPRDSPALKQGTTYEGDAKVVRDSQAQALEQAEAMKERLRDPKAVAMWDAAIREMKKALAGLQKATNSPANLTEALASEQAAYQALLRLQEHEYQVSRARNRNQGGGGGRNEQMQRQLEMMDLTQSDNRYETQRQAQPPQTAQRREQLQATSRLQELARRQKDLNDRFAELQTELQAARTEQERAEIERRLKRLQEEEQQVLSDVDELRQRMERPENQSRMAEERQGLEQTRDDLQRASEAASQGAASQALASGTRAQRQLQELHDQMRKANSSQFADDLRQMREQARELARTQEDLSKKLESEANSDHKSLSASPERQQILTQLAHQKELLTNLVDHSTEISQQAEETEPLLSKQLYDSVRKLTQDSAKDLKESQDELLNRGLMTRSLYDHLKESTEPDSSKLLDLTSEMLRLDFLPQARESGQRLRTETQELSRGIEHAAESVLGDDTEALRLAEQELDQLNRQLEREARQQEGSGGTNQQVRASGPRGSSSTNNQATSKNHQGQAREAAGQAESQTQESAEGTGGTQPTRSGEQTTPAGQRQAERPTAAGGQNANQQSASAQEQGSSPSLAGQRGGATSGGQSGLANAGGGDGGDLSGSLGRELNTLLDQTGLAAGPLTGEDFVAWSDRLREVEEMLDQTDLRNAVGNARERARVLRQAYRHDHKKPDWAVVRLQVMKPLAEVREKIAEELARRESREALVPIDRDPVPNRYSELVRRYYEQLGKDK